MEPNAVLEPGLPRLYHLLDNREIDPSYLLKHVRRGKEALADDMQSLGLRMDEASMTLAHPWSDIEVQAVILCIPSYESPEEIEGKAKATYFSHFYDDHPDRLFLDPDPHANKRLVEELKEKRNDIDAMINILGSVGDLCKCVSQSSKDQNAVMHAVHRMTYGGLIQLAGSSDFQRVCLTEHMNLALGRLTSGPLVRTMRRKVSPAAMYTTTKTVQELLHAFEGPVDFNLCELENLLSGPALFYHDIANEKEVEKTAFHDGYEPSIVDMLNMLVVFEGSIARFLDERRLLRLKQAQFFLETFMDKLPSELQVAYKVTLSRYKEVAEASSSN